MISYPLLVTSAVHVSDPNVCIRNSTDRLKYTLEAIEKWREIDPELFIVICDGSGFDFSSFFSDDAKVECLAFVNDQVGVAHNGKGFGEWQIIEYALNNSTFLLDSDYFCKCTGKLWVENFLELKQIFSGGFLFDAHTTGLRSIPNMQLNFLETKFLIAETKKFFNVFEDAGYEVNDQAGRYLETIFKLRLDECGVENFLSSVPFQIVGFSGSDGTFQQDNYFVKSSKRARRKILKFFCYRDNVFYV
jgi:hypothetical protein